MEKTKVRPSIPCVGPIDTCVEYIQADPAYHSTQDPIGYGPEGTISGTLDVAALEAAAAEDQRAADVAEVEENKDGITAQTVILGVRGKLNVPLPGNESPRVDTAMIPTGEQVLEPVVLDSDSSKTVTVPRGATILEIVSNGTFCEGQAEPDTAKGIIVQSGSVQRIPVQGRATWFFKRVGSDTVTIKGKFYTAL